MPLSKKQVDFLGNSNKGLNLAVGAIRSGKSFTHILRILKYILHEAHDDGEILLSAKRLDSIESNLVRPLRKIVEMDRDLAGCFKFPGNSDPIVFQDSRKRIVINKLGANDEKAEEAIRGMTLQAWFPDELTLHPQGFVRHGVGRLSAPPMLMVATSNPDSRTHFVYQDFIASGRAKTWNFTLQDNPSLTQEYIQTITEFYKPSPIYYARFILGEWAGDPDRQVIPEWYGAAGDVVQDHKRPRFFVPTIGMDVGHRDFTFVVFGYYDFENDLDIVEDELICRGETTDFIAKAIFEKEKALGYEKPVRYSDTDLRLIEDLGRLHGIGFAPTRKDSKQAQINALRIGIGSGRIRIHPRCENLIRHLEGGIWNDKKTEYERTERDGHFDGIDAMVYWYRNLAKGNPTPSTLPEWSKPDVFVSPKLVHNTNESNWDKLSGVNDE